MGDSIGEDPYGEVSYEKYWLEDNSNQISIITRRIGAITRLKMEHSRKYKIFKYGVGGRVHLHYDSYFDDAVDYDRITTWINYLSDVEVGGSTYFPNVNITVKPEKSSALLWYNFKKSGELDLKTLHGSCPVLFGTKWIAVKWISSRGQEFSNPCSQNVNDHNFLTLE